MDILKMSLSGLTPQSLSTKAQNLVDDMTGNANFATPEPALADITAKQVELDNWINKSSFGDERAINTRKTVYAELQKMLRTLAQYVSMTAKGDGNVILSSGFELRKNGAPTPPLTRPVDLSVTRTAYEGRVKLDWKTVKGTKSYIVMMTTENPESETAVWTAAATTTKSKLEVSDLTFGNYYYFRVKAVGANSESPFSEVAFIRAA